MIWSSRSTVPGSGLPEVKRGLIAAAGGMFRIVDQLPRKIAMQLLLTGEPISAEEALRWGLINQVVPDGESGTRRGDGAGRADHRQRTAGGAGQQRVAAGADDGAITAEKDA